MRLIDADALMEMLDTNPTLPSFLDVIRIIGKVPTIEPKTKVIAQVTFDEDKLREIVHEAVERIKEEYDIVDRPKGEWIAKTENYHSHWVCSECGAWALLEYNEQMCLSNFCPNCGAKMKGASDGRNENTNRR